MWPNKDFDYIKLDEDDQGIHYGLFVAEELVSVVSVFIRGDQAQFRKFATLTPHQNKGYGSTLLSYVFEEANRLGIKRIYCNARKEKGAFYKKFGLLETDHTFSKGGKDYVVMERLYVK